MKFLTTTSMIISSVSWYIYLVYVYIIYEIKLKNWQKIWKKFEKVKEELGKWNNKLDISLVIRIWIRGANFPSSSPYFIMDW